MRVVTYSRVSTAEQRDHGVSLDAQEAKTSGYAALYDLEVVAAIRDAGESGKNLERPGVRRQNVVQLEGDGCNDLTGLTVASVCHAT